MAIKTSFGAENCDDGCFSRFAAIGCAGSGFVEFLARAVGASLKDRPLMAEGWARMSRTGLGL